MEGAHIEVEKQAVHATVDGRLKGGEVVFDMVTVGGTENIYTMAVAQLITVMLHVNLKLLILRKMLIKMGAKN